MLFISATVPITTTLIGLNMKICSLTDQASNQVTQICQEHNVYAVSLNLKGGGCAGFEYEWSTVDTLEDVEPGSYTLGAIGGNLVIGPASLMFLAGTVVDYKRSIVGANFEITNPNAKSACGCGVSVEFDMDALNEPVVDKAEPLAYSVK